MQKIVVGFIRSPEGEAALKTAIDEAKLRSAQLIVVHSMYGGKREDETEVLAYRQELEAVDQQLTEDGVAHEMHEYVRGLSPSEDLTRTAKEENADLIVIGLRRRTPTGKFLLGSNAQEILLDADCPVLAVKADK
jgi:nucleotide-binding universal stress UspA family protein